MRSKNDPSLHFQTILLQNLYINPQNSAKTADGSHLANVTDEEMQVCFFFGKVTGLQIRVFLEPDHSW